MSENLNKKVNEEYKYKSKVKLLELFKFYETDRNLFRVMDETKYVKKVHFIFAPSQRFCYFCKQKNLK